MASLGSGPSVSTKLRLRSDWAGFDLVRVGTQLPQIQRRGDLAIISGCITTTSPMKNQSGWHLTVAEFDPRLGPLTDVIFLAPTMMSRYEGIYQCGTSTTLKPDGKIQIYFSKNTNPMVLHLSGICWSVSTEEPVPIEIADYELREWMQQQSSKQRGLGGIDEKARALEVDELAPPSLQRCGGVVCLQGLLKEAMYGTVSQKIGTLPEGFRPRREIRCLATLLQLGDSAGGGGGAFVGNSLAVTLWPSGAITVQGGKVHMVDAKGNMRVLQQNKKGILCLDGVRFALSEGEPIELSPHLASVGAAAPAEGKSKLKSLLPDLLPDPAENAASAVCVKEGDVVMLEGFLSWATAKPPNKKQPLAKLPQGCWPAFRQVFFTRGSNDLEERRRVDVDQYGRIFCPEGAPDGRVELTGVIFVAAPGQGPLPQDPDWDDLRLQYRSGEASVASTSFDGHYLLEQFVRQSNHHEWKLIAFDFDRHSGRNILMPLGQAQLKGQEKWNEYNLGRREHLLWRQYSKALSQHHGITTFHTLLHLSDGMFDRVARTIGMKEDDRMYLIEERRRARIDWATKRLSGFTYNALQGLAEDIVDQMFEHWDFKAQLLASLQHDNRVPETIRHLYPKGRGYGQPDRFIKGKLKDHEWERFEEARQFFYLYETTGTNMTHCSLMGSSDTFTTTGKWYFPDDMDTQKQLFEHIAWLFPRQIYLYISERQTSRFPFIEDLDIQCRTDWEGPPAPGTVGRPPDHLLMTKPQKDERGKIFGDPGELMRHRAEAVHMIYPHLEHLEVLVYSASGYNKGKDMLKSSFHLVWPQLIVDPDRAPVIRHVTLGRFRGETNKRGSYLNELQTKLLDLHDSNNWELVFDSTTINARNGLRLPYSDKASMVIASDEDKQKVKEGKLSKTSAFKKRVREGRPSKAIGRIRFEFEKDPTSGNPNGILKSAQWDADADSYSIAQWIEMGSCRREPSRAELTPWQLQQDVLDMLPTKPGERFTFEGEADGEGGHWVTHRPLDTIRRCGLSVMDFKNNFSEALLDEQEMLREEHKQELLRRIIGAWVHVNKNQAIWRGSAGGQCDAKDPSRLFGKGVIHRPVEVVYIKSKGKVLVDGPRDPVDGKDPVSLLLQVMRPFTRPDDVAVVPIYDVNKLS